MPLCKFFFFFFPETVEESSSTRTLYDTELSKLESYIQQLQREITDLKQEKNQSPHHTSQEHSSLAPSQVLNVLTKGFKKLGADSFSSQESDDGIKKVIIYLIDNSRRCRSVTFPCRTFSRPDKSSERKLRATDEQLQKCKECGHHQKEISKGIDQSSQHVNLNATTSTNTSFDASKVSVCDMCSNYEAQLVKEQKRTIELETNVQTAEKAAERHKEELLKEIARVGVVEVTSLTNLAASVCPDERKLICVEYANSASETVDLIFLVLSVFAWLLSSKESDRGRPFLFWLVVFPGGV
ncbi:hypothetical protein NQ314_018674 [Rhamnusium bicolor]|uniref:Uncharacterized protein n=1 Tax=Rhamnusium bicolor TaxID=1586634 RepID=A0AAV8WQJ3_9CUCU|nr:hypothetical protein NQ314_018674 [Rhamnusium bicolor]